MDPVVVASIVTVTPVVVLGVMGYQRGKGVDRLAAQTQALSVGQAGTNQLIDNLQEDNRELRGQVKHCNQELVSLRDRLVKLADRPGGS